MPLCWGPNMMFYREWESNDEECELAELGIVTDTWKMLTKDSLRDGVSHSASFP